MFRQKFAQFLIYFSNSPIKEKKAPHDYLKNLAHTAPSFPWFFFFFHFGLRTNFPLALIQYTRFVSEATLQLCWERSPEPADLMLCSGLFVPFLFCFTWFWAAFCGECFICSSTDSTLQSCFNAELCHLSCGCRYCETTPFLRQLITGGGDSVVFCIVEEKKNILKFFSMS